MEITARDMGAFVESKVVTLNNAATAGGTGDATEVTGTNIDVSGYDSGKLIISFETSLTADKTLSFAVKARQGATTAACTSATGAAILAATVVKTGACTAFEGVYELDLDLSGYKQFVGLDVTPELSHSGTDTANFGMVFVGLKKSI